MNSDRENIARRFAPQPLQASSGYLPAAPSFWRNPDLLRARGAFLMGLGWTAIGFTVAAWFVVGVALSIAEKLG